MMTLIYSRECLSLYFAVKGKLNVSFEYIRAVHDFIIDAYVYKGRVEGKYQQLIICKAI